MLNSSESQLSDGRYEFPPLLGVLYQVAGRQSWDLTFGLEIRGWNIIIIVLFFLAEYIAR